MSKSAELRTQITNQIIKAIEENDVFPWRRPWAMSNNIGLPRNVVSERLYSGVNPLTLEVHRMHFNFNSKWFGTFKQWQSVGGKVKRRPENVK